MGFQPTAGEVYIPQIVLVNVELVLDYNLFHKLRPRFREKLDIKLLEVGVFEMCNVQRFPTSILEDMSVGGKKSFKGMSHLDYFHFRVVGAILFFGVTVNNLRFGVKKIVFLGIV